MNEEKKNPITRDVAYEIANDHIGKYLTAKWGQRLVSDWNNPTQAYLQETNSWIQVGEVFSVACPGIGNIDMTRYRDGWENSHLTDAECILNCVENGDMSREIEQLAENIYDSAHNEY